MDIIEQTKQEIEEMGLGSLWSNCEIRDFETGYILAKESEIVLPENVDRVLHQVLVDDRSVWTIIDNGIFVATEVNR